MKHAEDMACGAESLSVSKNPILVPSRGCRPIKAWLQLWMIRSIPYLILPPVSFWCSKGFSVCSPHFSVSLPPDIFRGPPYSLFLTDNIPNPDSIHSVTDCCE